MWEGRLKGKCGGAHPRRKHVRSGYAAVGTVEGRLVSRDERCRKNADLAAKDDDFGTRSVQFNQLCMVSIQSS